MNKQLWLTNTNKLVIVHKVDKSLYYYEYSKDEYLLLEKSPAQFKLIYIGDL